jgi:hypothetical protein
VHAEPEGHETPLNQLEAPAVGFGVAWMDQPVPFQLSARVTTFSWLFVYCPTAVQSVADRHETPASELELAPLGRGVAWTDQLVPFQLSASTSVVPALLT